MLSDANPRTNILPLPPIGPMTRSRARKTQDKLSSLIHKELERERSVEQEVLCEKVPKVVNLLTIAESNGDSAGKKIDA